LIFVPLLQALLGELHPEQLTLFYTYARQVRHYITDQFPIVEPSTCAQLSQLEFGLLPNLISIVITFRGDPTAHLSLLPCYIRSNSIASFQCELADGNYQCFLGTCLSSLVKNTNPQNLHCLVLRGSLSDVYRTFLSRFHSLQSVTLCLSSKSWTFDVIHTLSCLQLVYVYFNFDSSDLTPKVALARTAFSTMTTLSLVGKMPWIFYILNSIAGDHLESITIEHHSCDRTCGTALKHAQLYQSCSRFTLLCEIIQVTKNWTRESVIYQPSVDSASIIQPFLGFAHLESLQVMMLQPWFRVTDRDMMALSAACPLLKVLHLCAIPSPWTINVRRPTPISLYAVAMDCHHLTDLSITLNMDERHMTLLFRVFSNPTLSCTGP
jgi:hypothetical protein